MEEEQQEQFIIDLTDGKRITAFCRSFVECIEVYGEENIVYIRRVKT